MPTTNFIGADCKIYGVPTGTITGTKPASYSEYKNVVEPAMQFISDFNCAIPISPTGELPSRTENIFLYNKPIIEGGKSPFNAAAANRLDELAPYWQIASTIIIKSDAYSGSVPIDECLSLFTNRLDLSTEANSGLYMAFVAVFGNSFANWFSWSSGTMWVQNSCLINLKTQQFAGEFPQPFFNVLNFRGTDACATQFLYKRYSGYTDRNFVTFNTFNSAIGNMNDTVLYTYASQTMMNANFINYLEEGYTPKPPTPPTPPAGDDPYSPGGTSGTGGGTGTFQESSDPIDFPSLPALSAVATGFITLFNPSLTQLKSLADHMWSNAFDIDTLKKLFADPMDAVLGLSIVPLIVPDGGTKNVKVGNIDTGISMNAAASQYVIVDCGTIEVKEYWGGYLDYAPYTKAEIYLPYVGTHPLELDDIMGKVIHVRYHVDILSGACAVYVKCGDSVLYNFVGHCACSIPITGNDWTNVINGVINIASSIGSMVATGGATAPAAASDIASSAVNNLKPTVEKSGALGSMGGMLSVQKPYLIITRPLQALPEGQSSYLGYPSFITSPLSEVSGYTEVEAIHLQGVNATEEELQEIEVLLKQGVII